MNFKDATFWFNKGYTIQKQRYRKTITSPKDNVDLVALDYYKSGVKLDPYHFGCVFNLGCCLYFTGQYANANKWFTMAIRT